MQIMPHRCEAPEPHGLLRPLMSVSLAFILGIGCGTMAPGLWCTAWVAVSVMAAGIAWCLWRGCIGLVLPLLFWVAIGYLCIQPWLKMQWPPDDVRHFIDQGKWQVDGSVVEPPETAGGNLRFDLAVRQLRQGLRQVEAHGRIRVSARGAGPALQRGDRVRVTGHLRDIRGFCNPGGFDYPRYMALQSLHARLFTQKVTLLDPQGHTHWLVWIDTLRQDLDRHMTVAVQRHPPATGQVLRALTLGRRDAISDDLRDAFNRCGVSHVLAISGLHIGMVAAMAFALFRHLLAWIPWLLHRAWVHKAAALLSLLPILAYGLLAGLSPSTQRAMIMVAAFVMTYWIGRRHDWFNAMAVAALIILVISPPSLMSVSFQLSFSAVLAILLGLRALPLPPVDPLQSRWRRWGARFGISVCVSVLATLGTAPLVMFYFNQVSWIGPLANLVVVPLTGLLVVPAGLIGIASVPLSATLAGLCWQAAAWGVDAMVGFIQFIDRLPHIAVTTVTPSSFEIILYYLFWAALLFWRKRTICLISLAAVFMAAGLDTAYWMHRRFGHEQMVVTAVDVGQGSANLLQLPGGFTVLVDGGGFSDNSAFNVGRSVLAPLLWRRKIKTVDLIILSHPNSDHLNGLLFILKRFKVGRIWSNHEPEDSQGYRQWRQLIVRQGIAHEPFDHLSRQMDQQGVKFEILAPPADFLVRRPKEPWRDLNSNSLVVRISWHDISFLFTGDVLARAEAEMVFRNGPEKLRSTVLFVPHHGSGSSSSQVLVDAVQPQEGIISAGWKNRFRFPNPKVVRRLKDSGCRIWRTDRCGAVEILTNGKDYSIQTCRAGKGGA